MFGRYGELLGSGGKQGEVQSMVLAGPAASPELPHSSSLISTSRGIQPRHDTATTGRVHIPLKGNSFGRSGKDSLG